MSRAARHSSCWIDSSAEMPVSAARVSMSSADRGQDPTTMSSRISPQFSVHFHIRYALDSKSAVSHHLLHRGYSELGNNASEFQ